MNTCLSEKKKKEGKRKITTDAMEILIDSFLNGFHEGLVIVIFLLFFMLGFFL